uniref:Rab-like protein 6 n=1 Tax=Mesocestoides corti TaxID=53468 RepID=A0A5K3ENP8_MESCO
MSKHLRQRMQIAHNFQIVFPLIYASFTNTVNEFAFLRPYYVTHRDLCAHLVKLLIRGERGTGKSALFSRLKGEDFDVEYVPTDEIRVACILWNYQPTSETVKVDVWDVVDKGRQREVTHGTKASGYMSKFKKRPQSTKAVASLDSTFIDVYQGANGVIFMFNITNKQTFEYVRRELPKVPQSVPVLVVGNFRDTVALSDEEREVSEIEARSFTQSMVRARQTSANSSSLSDDNFRDLRRQYLCAPIRYCEASMQNGFGLMYIHRFLNIPFLHLQCANLLQAFTVNRQAFSAVSQQLDLAEENREVICSYDKFTRWLETTKATATLPNSRSGVNGSSRAATRTQATPPLPQANNQHERYRLQRQPECRKQDESGNQSLPQTVPTEAEEAALHEFLQCSPQKHNRSTPATLPKSDLAVNLDPLDRPSDPVALVADFEEDIDPADAVLFGGANGRPSTCDDVGGVTARLGQLADSADDDLNDEDDDDLMNEDDDDDEEHLGPALGLVSTTLTDGVEAKRTFTKESRHRQFGHEVGSRLSSTTASCSSSSSPSLPGPVGQQSASLSATQTLALDPATDLGTLEERNAFERFLDDT